MASSYFHQLGDAVMKNNEQQVDFFLRIKEVNPNESLYGEDRKTLLSITCQNRNMSIVKMLLRKHFPADPNKANKDGKTGFFCALLTNDKTLVTLFLTECKVKVDFECCVSCNVDFNKVSVNIQTPLGHALMEQDLVLAEMLLKAGADPNYLPDMDNAFNSMAIAVEFENIDMCRLLLQYGCVPFCKDGKGCEIFAMHIAMHFKNVQLTKLFMQECAGTDILLSTFNWQQNLIVAVITEFLECVTLFFDHSYNEEGDSDDAKWKWIDPVHFAMSIHLDLQGSLTLVAEMMRLGIYTCCTSDINNCFTLLHQAAIWGHIKIMELAANFNPQCLQEDWLLYDIIPPKLAKHKEFVALLRESRKRPCRLDVLCRAKIIKQLGYKPLQKAQEIKLPRILMDFMLMKTTFAAIFSTTEQY